MAGDLLKSRQQTLVNTVNTVGVMGKGIALAFKKRYPDMFTDYVRRCDRGDLMLGRPYVFEESDHLVLNFPTKGHWRAVSKLSDIVAGLEHLERHYKEWGITSIAVPPLGCGNGQLEWEVVGPTLVRHLSRLDIPVELYAPAGATTDQEQLALLEEPSAEPRVPPEWVAVVAVLDRLQRQTYHWPVGRIMFQKLAYFATEAGIATGLAFERGSYGPFSPDLKRRIGQLENNGLAVETQRGNMFEVQVGPTYADAVARVRERMEPYRDAVERTVDLMARMNSTSAEVAATVHFVAAESFKESGIVPRLDEVVGSVEAWKPGRFKRDDVIDAAALLCMRGWSRIEVDEEMASLVETRLSA
ncbi:type II toxin-antitoxin system antitoxin DNA ADP-ribosyl glycohydrolase DarG [Nocardioides sp. KR10-350]|uniref:type II toxin-antitoxin system antitoxin DNA ADP-ribosyl glycohydrolase DarG n=1 Tax=Nocardioides cheoyonin TaxID=3156615 RepID=UPI0032B43288